MLAPPPLGTWSLTWSETSDDNDLGGWALPLQEHAAWPLGWVFEAARCPPRGQLLLCHC